MATAARAGEQATSRTVDARARRMLCLLLAHCGVSVTAGTITGPGALFEVTTAFGGDMDCTLNSDATCFRSPRYPLVYYNGGYCEIKVLADVELTVSDWRGTEQDHDYLEVNGPRFTGPNAVTSSGYPLEGYSVATNSIIKFAADSTINDEGFEVCGAFVTPLLLQSTSQGCACEYESERAASQNRASGVHVCYSPRRNGFARLGCWAGLLILPSPPPPPSPPSSPPLPPAPPSSPGVGTAPLHLSAVAGVLRLQPPRPRVSYPPQPAPSQGGLPEVLVL
jgi:hypothetical protein